MEFCITIEWAKMGLVLAALAVFGIGYNLWVESLENRGHDRGYMAFIVAIGCAMTIIGAALGTGSWQLATVVFVAFVFSGTPMIVGSVLRYIQAREREELALGQLIGGLLRSGDDDTGKAGRLLGQGGIGDSDELQ